MIRFSIITCSLNNAKYIGDNFNSVAQQDFKNFEHIIVDGNSSDGSKEQIEKYLQEYPNTRVVYTNPKGIANAMNVGIRKAQGEYLLFLNSDDQLADKSVLSYVNHFISNSKSTWFYGQIRYLQGKEIIFNPYPNRWYHKKVRFFLLLLTNYISHPAVFMNKSIFSRHGLYQESLRGGMDYEYWLRISKKEKASYMPKVISIFRIGGFSTNPENEKMQELETYQIRLKYAYFAKLLMLPAKVYRKIFSKKSIKV